MLFLCPFDTILSDIPCIRVISVRGGLKVLHFGHKLLLRCSKVIFLALWWTKRSVNRVRLSTCTSLSLSVCLLLVIIIVHCLGHQRRHGLQMGGGALHLVFHNAGLFSCGGLVLSCLLGCLFVLLTHGSHFVGLFLVLTDEVFDVWTALGGLADLFPGVFLILGTVEVAALHMYTADLGLVAQ